MAEGLARALAPPGYRFLSAGSDPGMLNPLAVVALRETGVDISHHHAKGLDGIALEQVDTIVTLCAEEVCPVVPATTRRLHWPLRDPAAVQGTPDQRLAAFREIRDRLRDKLPELWTPSA
jgi:arsenate reductase